MISRLEQLQQTIADQIGRRETLRGVKIILDRAPTLEGKLDEKLYAKLGLSIVVKMPAPTKASPGSTGPTFDEVQIKVRVFENIPTNTNALTAAYAAEQALKALNLYAPPFSWVTSTLKPRTDYPWYALTGTTTTNAVELTLTTSMTL